VPAAEHRLRRQRGGKAGATRLRDRLAVGLVFVVGVTAALGIAATRVQATGAEALPDLAMTPLSDFRIQTVNGRRVLRFTAMWANIGSGAFEVRGSRASTSEPMRASQVIYDTGGQVSRSVPSQAVMQWSGDGHDHWHVMEMSRYDMWGADGTFRGAKIGLCFLDSDPWNLSLPGARRSPYYQYTWCGQRSALNNRMGVSVGWADEYEWYLAWQWIDIEHVPAGTYIVRAKADPYGYFLEENEANQCAWARVRFGSSGTAVTVEARGGGCVNDIDGSIFAEDIAWAYAQGISTGCAPDLFCTNSRVTRQEMASFLARALALPAASRDFFTDDESSIHEADINRVAAAGITTGCTATRYCPTQVVRRDQMASFLARALALPVASRDHFTDDGGSIHQSDINRVADAGVAQGCGGGRYCPTQGVRRGQMAAFLHRALE
jgi:hypothetical protein